MMRKIFLLFLTAILFCANIFATEANAKSAHINFDAVGPVISYSLLGSSGCTTIRTFTATITDGDDVNTTPGTAPRVYYRRTTDANNFLDNTVATNGWKYAEATNVGNVFTFGIDYSLLYLGTGVTPGQTIQYFVVAQDLYITPNISINSGSFVSPPSSVALTSTAFPIGCCSNIFSVVNALPTNITIGAGQSFTSLSMASGLFSAINSSGLSGNTIVEIVDPVVTENNANFLSQIQNAGCGAGAVNLLIKPAAGITSTLTGTVGTKPIITILSSNVTIDGSNNGTTSRNLTLQNNGTGGNVIFYGSSGTQPTINSTLKNTTCVNGSNIFSAACVVVADIVTGAYGYFNDITIQNNSIQKSQIGIVVTAVSAAGNGTNFLITGNDLNSLAPDQIGLLGIYTEGVDGAVISNNNIGNFEASVTGPRYGIQLLTNSINSTVSGNNILDISYSGSATALAYGIYVEPFVATSNNNITGNIISSLTSTGTATVYGISLAGASGGITIQKNNISNIKNVNNAGYGAYGIGLSSSLTASNNTVANNFIYDVAGSGVSTIARNGHGIYLNAGGGYKIYYNSVNMNANQVNPVSGLSAALTINGVSTPSSLDIRNNIFANSQTGSGPPQAARYAIYSANPNTIFSFIDNNDYYTATGTNLGFISGARATLTDIQNGFGSNLNSINVQPNFVAVNDLHLTTANCSIDNMATPVSIITDIDAASRNALTPDMGADEFTSVYTGNLAGIISAAVCDYRTVSATGTTYVTNACDLIAKVEPTGGSPVAGKINACVTLDAAPQFFNGEPYVQRHYDLEPLVSNETSTSATITLYFTDLEFENYNALNTIWPPLPTVANGANIDPNRFNVRITQFHGTATISPSSPGLYTGGRVLINPGAANVVWNGTYWAVTFPITGFSGFYLHTSIFNTPLPVSVNYLTGRRQGGNHLLNWKVTCNSSPRANMVLQRSNDSRSFADELYSITADALRCNQPFDYIDVDPLKGMNYYRLKITDADGKITYSTTVALLNAVKGFDIISIAPNPVVADNFKLNVTSAQPGKIVLSIFDMQGRLVNKQTISLIAGYSSLPVSVANLSAGTYTIKAIMGDDKFKVIRFVKQ